MSEVKNRKKNGKDNKNKKQKHKEKQKQKQQDKKAKEKTTTEKLKREKKNVKKEKLKMVQNKQLIIFMMLKMETTMELQEDEYVGYFGDNWNVLDFLIVASCWIVAFGDVLRIFRALRTITKIQGWK